MKSVLELEIAAPPVHRAVIFKGLLGHLFGLVGYFAIKRAHRRHMEAFKRFAEGH